MSRPLDALDAALDAFQATGATTEDADPPGSDPQESVTVPLGATVAPAVAPLEPTGNCSFSTRATGATTNHDIQLWEIRTNAIRENAHWIGPGARARSLILLVALAACRT